MNINEHRLLRGADGETMLPTMQVITDDLVQQIAKLGGSRQDLINVGALLVLTAVANLSLDIATKHDAVDQLHQQLHTALNMIEDRKGMHQ
jgi:hypothetical protein